MESSEKGFVQELPVILYKNFKRWGRYSPRYRTMYLKVNQDHLEIALAFFTEVKILYAGSLEIWWARAHNRYIRKFKQRDITVVFELIHNFVLDLCRGISYDGESEEEAKFEKRGPGRPRKVLSEKPDHVSSS
jgi:hypothetical protein